MGSYANPDNIITDYTAFEKSLLSSYERGEEAKDKAENRKLKKEELDLRYGDNLKKQKEADLKIENAALKYNEEVFSEVENGHLDLVDNDKLINDYKVINYNNETGRDKGTVEASQYAKTRGNVLASVKLLKSTQTFLSENNKVFSEASDLGTISKDPETIENTKFTNAIDKGRGEYVTKDDGILYLKAEVEPGVFIERSNVDINLLSLALSDVYSKFNAGSLTVEFTEKEQGGVNYYSLTFKERNRENNRLHDRTRYPNLGHYIKNKVC